MPAVVPRLPRIDYSKLPKKTLAEVEAADADRGPDLPDDRPLFLRTRTHMDVAKHEAEKKKGA